MIVLQLRIEDYEFMFPQLLPLPLLPLQISKLNLTLNVIFPLVSVYVCPMVSWELRSLFLIVIYKD